MVEPPLLFLVEIATWIKLWPLVTGRPATTFRIEVVSVLILFLPSSVDLVSERILW